MVFLRSYQVISWHIVGFTNSRHTISIKLIFLLEFSLTHIRVKVYYPHVHRKVLRESTENLWIKFQVSELYIKTIEVNLFVTALSG